MGWIDDLMGKQLRYGGAFIAQRKILDISGNGVTVADDPTNGRTSMVISQGAIPGLTAVLTAGVSAGGLVPTNLGAPTGPGMAARLQDLRLMLQTNNDANGNTITGLGAPSALTDAARLQDTGFAGGRSQDLSADYALTAADNGKFFTNTGAAGIVNITAAAGLPKDFSFGMVWTNTGIGAGQKFFFKSQGGEQITGNATNGTQMACGNIGGTLVFKRFATSGPWYNVMLLNNAGYLA